MPNVRVVLIKDVPSLGQIGDIAAVAAGYARNFLLPRGLAVTASTKRLADTHFQRELTDRRDAAVREAAEGIASVLQGQSITIAVVVGGQGRMHGQITNQDVAGAIREELGVEIDRHSLQIDSPIRSLGRYLLPIRIAAGVEASITLEVTEFEEPAEEPEAAEEAEASDSEVPEIDFSR